MKDWIRIASFTVASGLALAAGTMSAAASTVFTDGDFINVNLSPVLQDGPSIVTIQAPCPTCGTAGSKGIGLTFNTQNSNPAVLTTASFGVVENGFSYNPSTQGAITSIDASVDKHIAITTPVPIPYTSAFYPLIFQDGNYYMAQVVLGSYVAPNDTGYVAASQAGLTAGDFSLYSFLDGTTGAGHPDFAGDPLQFGLGSLSRSFAGTVLNVGYDNLRFQVNAVAPAETPIPGTLPLLATGLAAIGMAARRRSRMSA